MNYYIARIARNKSRTYLDTRGKFTAKLYRNKYAGTLKFNDAVPALAIAAEFDALVLTEGSYGLVTI